MPWELRARQCAEQELYLFLFTCAGWQHVVGGWSSHVQHRVQNISDAAGYGVSRSEAAVPATAENIPIF